MTTAAHRGGAGPVPALVAILRDGGGAERCLAARALGRIGDRTAVPALIETLLDPDPDLRGDTAEALRDLRDARAADQLLENLLGDPEATVKLAAIGALAQAGDRRVVAWLRRLVRDRDPEIVWDDEAFSQSGWDDWTDVQLAAIAAIAEMQEAEAVPDIVAALSDEDAQDLTEAGFSALARLGPDGIAALAEFLHDPSARLRRRAATALAGCHEGVAAALATAFDDPDPQVRLAALRRRGQVVPDDPLLAQMMFDPDPGVRAEALRIVPDLDADLVTVMVDDPAHAVQAVALRRLAGGDRISAEPALAGRLGELAGDPDAGVSAAASSALAALDPGGAQDRLAALTLDAGRPDAARLAALEALARLAGPAPVDALAAAAGDDKPRIAVAALTALAGLACRSEAWPTPAGEVLLAALSGATAVAENDEDDREDDDPEPPVEAGCDASDDAAAYPAATLASIMEHNERIAPPRRRLSPNAATAEPLRVVAARLLGEVVHADVAAALTGALRAPNTDLAAAAAEALGRLAGKGLDLAPETVDALVLAAGAGARALRAAAIRALGCVPAPEARAALADALNDADPGLRACAARALATAGLGELSAERLGDPAPAVRLAAAQAVAAAGDPDAVPVLVEVGLSGAGDLARPVAGLLRGLDTKGANAAVLAVLTDLSRRRDRCLAIEMLEDLNRSIPADAQDVDAAQHCQPEV